jgi:hypothetical protein
MAKHKYIETPEKLWDWFCDYVQWCKENPRIKIEYVGKDGDRVETPLERPLTIEGFKILCYEKGCDIQRYWNNVDNAYDEYVTIITRIKDIIRENQISGGMVGLYNSNLTARLNNLKESTENTNINHNTNILNIDPLDDSADNRIKEDSSTKETD